MWFYSGSCTKCLANNIIVACKIKHEIFQQYLPVSTLCILSHFRIDDGPLPAECALKVFKTTLSEFKTRERYIKDDHRFRDRFQKQNPRKIIKLWAEKEFRNLKR